MKVSWLFFAAAAIGVSAGDLVVETDGFRLVVGTNAVVKSIVVKANGEECAAPSLVAPLFSVTQDRPFNNEIKLSEPMRRTTYPAESLRQDGDRLVAGFRHRQYEAVVRLRKGKGYIAFELEKFNCDRASSYSYLKMDIPPVAAFRILPVPVHGRKNFGSWLNACWDEEAAVAVVGTSPHPDVGSEERGDDRLLRADLSADIGLCGHGAALVAAPGRERFLDAMDALEADFGLPRGVRSRRSPEIYEAIFHTHGDCPLAEVDELVAYARRGGFRLMTFSDSDVAKTLDSWQLHGDYDWRSDFPRDEGELKAALGKVKAAGIRPGFHTLHPHIGLKSRYVTPVADPRLNKTRRFTLAGEVPEAADVGEIRVLEPVDGVPMHEGCRVLQFGGELMTYESAQTGRPSRFLGVRRGALNTRREGHRLGTVGGILDVSEYGMPGSCYLDQNTDLQDEVAEKLARFYNCGFEYVYMDGSEGVNRPFGFHVANAQYRYWKLLGQEPLFGEAAAKSHFSWHMLAGANAFDCFEPQRFKAMLRKHPAAQAPRTWQDMTRVNFGWWCLFLPSEECTGTQLDMWEYGMALAAAWDGAASALMSVDTLKAHPRADDILETMRRWNDLRRRGPLDERWRTMLRDASREHHLLVNGKGEYELVEIEQLAVGGNPDGDVRAFTFRRNGRSCVMFWHTKGERRLFVRLPADRVRVAHGPDDAGERPQAGSDGTLLRVAERQYLVTDLPMATVRQAFEQATAPESTYDLVVYGSTPAAMSAAVQARRMGISAVVVSPETRLGGLTTGGLGQTDIGNKKAFGGIALEFYKAVASHYRLDRAWKWQKREDYLPDGQCAGTKGTDSMWTFEPHVALEILERWVRRDGLEVIRGERLDRSKAGVEMDGGRIRSIRTLSGRIFRGRMFVDATYEGDLMAAAGCSYVVGREPNSQYGETISGIETREARFHQFAKGVDPYVVKGDPSSGLLPYVEPYNPSERDGDGDSRVQAYCFRMCLTDVPENRIPFAKPAGYSERNYELLLRNFEAGESFVPWINSKMPNRKTDTNNSRGFSTDFVGQNWRWPEGSYEERDAILKAHLEYQQGLMWTLANHPRVPERIRKEVSRWGTCRDEFADGLGSGWQSQLYVREARRLVGEYVVTEHDCRGDRRCARPVAMGAYGMDSHNVRRHVGADGFVHNEGDVEDHKRYSQWGARGADAKNGGGFPPYGIDYGAVVPQRKDCVNLFVPVCLSASHMAFGSIRMEPVFFALGQTVATAAAQAIAADVAVQDLPYGPLRERLLADGQVLEWPAAR